MSSTAFTNLARADRAALATGSLVLLAALLLPGVAVAQQAGSTAADVDVVALTFAWPVGMTASVEREGFRVKQADGPPVESGIHVTYDLEVFEHPDGRLILFRNVGIPGMPAPQDAEPLMAHAVSGTAPGYIVSDAGRLLDVHQLDDLHSAMMDLWRREVGSQPDDEQEAVLGQLLSRETLSAIVAQEWEALVGFWAGTELEVGAVYEMQAEEPLPLLDNALVLYRYEFGVSERLPCLPTGVELDCVELIVRSYPDPDSLQSRVRALIERVRGTADADMPQPSFKTFDTMNEIIVVAEPGSLIPHALTITRLLEAEQDRDGVEQAVSDYRRTRYTYTYR